MINRVTVPATATAAIAALLTLLPDTSQAALTITYSSVSETQTLAKLEGFVDLGSEWKTVPTNSFTNGIFRADLNDNRLAIAQPSTVYYADLPSGFGSLSQDPWTGFPGSTTGSGASGVGALFVADNSVYIWSATEWGGAVTADNGGRITWNSEATFNTPLSTFNTGNLVVSYPGGLDLTIERIAVPEPTSIAFLATGGLAAGVVAVARRRRRTRACS